MNNEDKLQQDSSGKFIWILLVVVFVGLFSWVVYRQFIFKKFTPISQIGNLQISSPAFKVGSEIPRIYTCRGDGISPPLVFKDVPKNANNLVLILHDPDAPAGDFAHWIMWNIKPSTKKIAENSVPAGAMQGTNDFAKIGYSSPCPPSGTHTYYFDLYALDTKLSLAEQAQYFDLVKAIKNHVISQTSPTATSTK